jgi:hypothetical protein
MYGGLKTRSAILILGTRRKRVVSFTPRPLYPAETAPPVHIAVCSLQPPAHADSSLADLFTLKIEAIRSSETSVHMRSTRRHIPEDGMLQARHAPAYHNRIQSLKLGWQAAWHLLLRSTSLITVGQV